MRVRCAGRVMQLRHMGKAGFAHLQQNGERLQIYVKKDAVGERDFQLFKMLDIGDIVGVEGYLFRTRTGELSVHAEKLEFLSKTLLSMPEKWHGLEDVETRYRQRYLDLIANPEVRKVFVTRARIVSSLRRQLEARGFIEVETPMMQPLYGGAAARPFVTHHNTLDIDLYLRIAPELVSEAPGGGRAGAGLRNQPQFPQRRPFHAPQSRVHHAGVLPGVHGLPRPDGFFSGTAGARPRSTPPERPPCEFEGHTLDFSRLERYSMREAVVAFLGGRGRSRPPEDVCDPAWLLAPLRQSHRGRSADRYLRAHRGAASSSSPR